jgi:hypothetical protein
MGNVRKRLGKEHGAALIRCFAVLAVSLPGIGSAQAAHASHAAPAARVPTARLPASIVSEGGAFAMALATSPSPIRLNEPFELTVVVRALEGDGGGALSVTVDARMPAHQHGMNTRPSREQLSDDRLLFRGLLLHMAGDWEVVIDAAQGRVRDRGVVRVVIE